LPRTPLHFWHVSHGARLVVRDGWPVPASYRDLELETAAARSAVALADISAFARVSLLGKGMAAATMTLLGHTAAVRTRGVASITASGPTLACRLTVDHLLLLGSAPGQRLTEVCANLSALHYDVTSAHAEFWLAGPHTRELLRRLTPVDVALNALPPGLCAETGLAGVPVLLVPTSALSVPSVRLCVARDVGAFVWERLLEAGRTFQVTPMGLDALEALTWVPAP
jgi:heterotetrameric sarcosine oxidase gamma subunit